MKTRILTLLLLIAALGLSGCRSEHATPKQAAAAMCRAAKNLNLPQMKRLSAPFLHAHLEAQYARIGSLSPSEHAELLETLDRAPACKASHAVWHKDGSVAVTLESMGSYRVKNLGGLWKVVGF